MVRRFFRKFSFSGNGILFLGAALSLSLFALEGLVSSLLFKTGPFKDHFFPTNPHDVLIHYLPVLVMIGFSGLTQMAVKKYVQVESSLKDRENRLRLITTQMPAILWTTDKNLLITSATGSALKNLDMTRDSIEGVSLFEILNTVDSNFPIIEGHLQALRGESVQRDLSFRGSTYTAYLEPIRNRQDEISGCIGIALDVTDQKRTREALEESENRLSGILNVAADAIITTDSDNKITLFNTGAERIFGYSVEEVKGLDIENLIPARFREQHRLLIKAFGAEIQSSRAMSEGREIVGLRKDQTEFPAEASISKLSRNGELTFIVILRDITPRKEAEEMIQHLAYTDPLTGLPNRTKLHGLLGEAIRKARGNEELVAFLLIDLDRFKEVNDTLGHMRGDLLLQEVASRLKSVLRPTDKIARLGGDEFGLVLPIKRGMDATIVAGKVKIALEEPYEIEGIPVAIDASIGIALAPDHGANADSLIQRADVAMYTSKETATGFSVYSTKQDRHSPRRLALMGELRKAIEEDQLCLHYQPKVSFPDLSVDGVEGLVRWPHPIFGIIPPDQFIIPAEQTGLIDPLTRWVLMEALRQCLDWKRAGIEMTIAVNLSVRNLQDRQLPKMVEDLLDSSGVSPACLELEVTESAIMADPEKGIDVLRRLDRLGVRLSIDDFGTGYSSLSSLKKLPVKELKIDKSFIRNLNRDEENSLIVRSTIELAHNLGLEVVAEGVEDRETLRKLEDLGCDAVQGFHVCRPLPPSDLTPWLKEKTTSPIPGSP